MCGAELSTDREFRRRSGERHNVVSLAFTAKDCQNRLVETKLKNRQIWHVVCNWITCTQPPFGMDEQVLNEEYIAAAG